jgi:mitofusin
MLDEISACVTRCETYARDKSVQGVNMIQTLGLLHVGEDKFPKLGFRSDLMFKQRRHALGRQVETQVDIWDFLDIPSFWERQEKVASTGLAMTVVTIVGGRAFGGAGWIDGVLGAIRILGPNNVRRLIVPSILGAGKCSP